MVAILFFSCLLAIVLSNHLYSEGAAVLVAGTAGALATIPTVIVVSWLREAGRSPHPAARQDDPPMVPAHVARGLSMPPPSLGLTAWLSESYAHMPVATVSTRSPALANPMRAHPNTGLRRFTVVGGMGDVLEAVDLDEMWLES